MRSSVNIVGAGAVGLYLAYRLAAEGIDVTVYDGKKDIRDRSDTASGILSKRGLGRFKIDYSDALMNELDGVVMHVNGKAMRVKATEPRAVVLDRGIFAEILMGMAEDAGAEVLLGRRLEKWQIIDMIAEKNRVVVGADGAVSAVASAAGLDRIREYILTYKAVFGGIDVKDTGSAELFFSKSFADRFFGWTVPYSDSLLEAGLGISDSAKTSSKMAFSKFVEEELGDIVSGAKSIGGHASVIPISRRRRTATDNVILVGDAAGQTKSTTGGGIIFGMACAEIAAKSISMHLRDGVKLSRYERMWRSRYGLDLKLHDALHAYYSNFQGSFGFFIGMAETLGLDKFFGKYGDMDSPSLMIKRFFMRSV